MTQEQIQLVKRSWKVFKGIDPNVLGDAFYSKIFAENAALKKMFPSNLDAQYRKLFDMLSTIVARLDRFDEMEHEINALARRHVKYGVRPGHYRIVGNALIWTLREGLGRDWSSSISDAWLECYRKLSSMMIDASLNEHHTAE